MKVCHILPPKVLNYDPAIEGQLDSAHLLLPALMSSQQYVKYYQERPDDDFRILDNGAAEGRRFSFPHVMAMARVAKAREVVLPDVIKDMDGTLQLLAQTFYEAFQYRTQYQFMLVLQGTTISELIHCAEQAMNMCPILINTFGIPRHILDYSSDARAEVALSLNRRHPNRAIHLLGTHPNYPAELCDNADAFQFANVRSVDTSLAWNATLQSVPLKETKSLSYNSSIGRQSIDEFYRASLEYPVEPERTPLLVENMKEINGWVK